MNAILRDPCEAPVLTHETIEVHLHYLRSGLDSVQTALPVLRDKIDSLAAAVDSKLEKTNARIDALGISLTEQIKETNTRIESVNKETHARIDSVNESLSARVESFNTSLSAKIDSVSTSLSAKIESAVGKANEARASGDAALEYRLDKLTDTVMKIDKNVSDLQASQKALFWFIGATGTMLALLSLAERLHWF
jgi:DNA anti-recombination protein RmuC